MAVRALTSLSISFGLVAIPVKVYSATESSAAVHFKLMGRGGARLRQQYVAAEPIDDGPDASELPAAVPDSGGVTTPVRSRAAPAKAAFEPAAAAAPPARAPSMAPAWSPPAAPSLERARSTEVAQPVAASSESTRERAEVVERADMLKGYEYEKGRFVLFTPAELKALADASRHSIDIVSFIPERAVDPIYYDKAYVLAPEKAGRKPYTLLLRAMQATGRWALAKWAWRAKEYVVQIRAADGGLVLQQLLYADEVRSLDQFGIELADVAAGELALAEQLIEQISHDAYDPTEFVDEEKQRILAAVERKLAGGEVSQSAAPTPTGQVIDLMAALRASLTAAGAGPAPAASPTARGPAPGKRASRRKSPTTGAAPLDIGGALKERKPPRRAEAATPPAAAKTATRKARAG